MHTRPVSVSVMSVLILSSACSSGGDREIHFSGTMEALPGADIDTGFQPADSPTQVRIVARSGGEVTAEASATVDGADLVPTAGSGRVAMAAALALEVHARVNAAGASFEGLVDTVELTLAPAEARFDPFLLDGMDVALTADLVPAELLSLPLAGVPGGTIVLSATGGMLTGSFAGTCAAIRDRVASYRAAITWRGTIELAATIQIDTPLGGDSFEPLVIVVDIPRFTTQFDLGSRSIADGAPTTAASACDDAAPGGDDCGPATCDGCCDGATCRDGTSIEACGGGGASCAVCATSVECDESAGLCRPSDGSLWTITIEEAHFAAQDCGSDGAWDDAGTLPDPYLEIAALDVPSLGRTSTAADTLSAAWSETVGPVAASVLDRGVMLLAYDDDGDLDDLMGACFAIAPEAFEGGGDFHVQCPRDCTTGDSGFDVRFQVLPY